MRHVGLDVFHRKPGERERMTCRVCGRECEVERNALRPTCTAMAMARRAVRHDRFFCRHSEEEWHREACFLVQEIQGTRSHRVRELIRKDLEAVLSHGGLARPASHCPNHRQPREEANS